MKSIQRDLERFKGPGLSQADVIRYLGVSRNTALKFLCDIPSISMGRKRIYLAKDIAKKIYNTQI